jgi:hypothetical protein
VLRDPWEGEKDGREIVDLQIHDHSFGAFGASRELLHNPHPAACSVNMECNQMFSYYQIK